MSKKIIEAFRLTGELMEDELSRVSAFMFDEIERVEEKRTADRVVDREAVIGMLTHLKQQLDFVTSQNKAGPSKGGKATKQRRSTKPSRR